MISDLLTGYHVIQAPDFGTGSQEGFTVTPDQLIEAFNEEFAPVTTGIKKMDTYFLLGRGCAPDTPTLCDDLVAIAIQLQITIAEAVVGSSSRLAPVSRDRLGQMEP